MMVLKELECLSIDLFLQSREKSTIVSNGTMSIDIAKDYSQFLADHDSTDDRRNYMFDFITMAVYE